MKWNFLYNRMYIVTLSCPWLTNIAFLLLRDGWLTKKSICWTEDKRQATIMNKKEAKTIMKSIKPFKPTLIEIIR